MPPKKELAQHLIKKKLIESKKGASPFVLIMVILGVILGGLAIYFIGKTFLGDKDIANFIPAEKTIAFLEMKNGILPSAMESDLLTAETIGQLTQTTLGFNINELSPNWAKKRFGMVMVEGNDQPEWVFFFEMGSKRSGTGKLEELNLVDKVEDSNAVLSHSQKGGRYFGFLDLYLITSTSEAAIQTLLETQDHERLSEDAEYQKTLSHLPRLFWLRGYLNPQKWKSKDVVSNMMLEPLKFGMNHMIFTAKKQSNGFQFNSLASLNKDMLSLNHTAASQESKFAYELSRFIREDKVSFYTGGKDLFDEWQNTLESMENVNPSYSHILEALVNGQFINVFGEGVSLRNDLYPILEGEYAFWMGQENSKPTYQLVLTHNDQEFSKIKLEKLMEGFKFLSGRFNPEVRVVELPDGTESRELVANQSLQEVETEGYQGQEFSCLASSASERNFCYTVGEDWLAMSNSKASILEAIQLSSDPANSLYESQTFRRNLSNLSKVTDELSFIKFDPLISAFESNPYITLAKPFLASFDSSTWVKHSFDDGMSWEGFILLK